MSALSAFLGEAIDDAGLFPPAQLSMADALAAHARYESGPHSWMLGRFVAPAARARELLEALRGAARPLRASFVLDGPERVAELAGLRERASATLTIETLECPLARLPGATEDEQLAALFAATTAAGFARELPVYVEVDARNADASASALASIQRARRRGVYACGKLRCGGAGADATPAPAIVAAFIWEANRLRVPFKATAGLHHPVRAFNRTAGHTMHGFLNVVGGAVLAQARGLDRATLERTIADEAVESFELDERRFEWRGIGADAEETKEARATLVHSFGSCSFDEPLDDLRALGMLQQKDPA